jgi:2-C-methyl-D-erythritol 4-phosphate cytidylyltransferase
MINQFAIIVAGGSGNRMGSKIPKQFLPIAGKPILMHTIERFLEVSPTIQVILVLPSHQMNDWHLLCDQHDFYPAIITTNGGATRFQSVKNGLKCVRVKDGLVAVHDGVRPFVDVETIRQTYQIAAQDGAAVVAVAPKDSLRVVDQTGNKAVDRTAYRIIQTPQIFRLDWMQKAFETEDKPFFTDCASVLEHAGYAITLVDGNYENIKITTPEDLVWAEAFLSPK